MMGKLVIRYNDNNNLEQQSTTIKVVKLNKNKDLLQKKATIILTIFDRKRWPNKIKKINDQYPQY